MSTTEIRKLLQTIKERTDRMCQQVPAGQYRTDLMANGNDLNTLGSLILTRIENIEKRLEKK